MYISGLSKHDGQYSNPSKTFYRNFSQIPTLEVKPQILFNLKKKIIAQFLHWKDIFLELASNNRLIYNISETKNFKFKFYTAGRTSGDTLLLSPINYATTFFEKKL